MNKSNASKQAVVDMIKNHKALTRDDVIIMFAVLNKYGLDMLIELQERLWKLMGLYEELPDKYKKVREKVNEILDL